MVDFTPTLMPLPGQQPVPPGSYATPSQLKAQQDYALALRSGTGQQPVHHWTQGVSNMFAALMGHNLVNQNADMERAKNQITANQQNIPYATPPTPNALTSGAPGAPPLQYTSASGTPQPFNGGPSSEGQTNSGESRAVAGIESGGNYEAVGRPTRDGDRAYGKYQVMGKNIPEWTRASLRKEMTPDEFLANPQAQEAVFKNKFGEYSQKYGPEGAARAWFAGEHGMNNPNAADANGMTVARYGQQFSNAFNGQGDSSGQNPAVRAISSALRNDGAQVAAGAKTPAGPLPQPSGGQPPLIDPSLAPRVPPISRERMQDILANPYISPEDKRAYQQMFLQQGQAVAVPYPGGKVLIDPMNPSRQQFIPELQSGVKKLPGGLEKPYPYTITPGPGGTINTSPAGTNGPHSEAAPVVAPTGGSPATPPAGPATAQTAPAAPTMPSGAPPVQVASLDPTAGVAAAAGNARLTPIQQQMMKMAGPNQPVSGLGPSASSSTVAAPPAGPQVAAQAPPAGSQVAANATATPPVNPLAQAIRTKPPSSDYTQEDWNSITGYKDLERQNDIDKEAGVKGVDASMKKYDTLSTQASNARRLLPNIQIAQELMKDPNFDSGITGPINLAYSRVKAAFPSLFGEGAQYAAAPNEVFGKVIAQSILDNMRTSLAGLGQVRVAEIKLLEQATASINNTPAANRALLEISRRALTQLDRVDQLGQMYQSGGEVTDPVDGRILLKANVNNAGEPQPRRGLDVGFDKLARQFVEEHPTTTEEEAKNYTNFFKTGEPGKEQGRVEQPGTATTLEATQPGMIYKGMKYLGGDKTNKESWEKVPAR
jgi:hypothetical protein